MTSNPIVFSSHRLSPTLKHLFQTFLHCSHFWSPSPQYLLLAGGYLFFISQEKWELQVIVHTTSFCLFYELASATILLSLLLLQNKCSRSLWTELLSLLLWIPSSFAFSGASWIISSLSFIFYFSLLFVFLPFVIRNVKTAVMFPHFFLSFRAKHCCKIYTPPPCFHFLCLSFPLHFSLASTQDPIKNC